MPVMRTSRRTGPLRHGAQRRRIHAERRNDFFTHQDDNASAAAAAIKYAANDAIDTAKKAKHLVEAVSRGRAKYVVALENLLELLSPGAAQHNLDLATTSVNDMISSFQQLDTALEDGADKASQNGCASDSAIMTDSETDSETDDDNDDDVCDDSMTMDTITEESARVTPLKEAKDVFSQLGRLKTPLKDMVSALNRAETVLNRCVALYRRSTNIRRDSTLRLTALRYARFEVHDATTAIMEERSNVKKQRTLAAQCLASLGSVEA
ncbi:hypothetical protein SCUCBS95973_002378 [Sporothrix curviconia]|uniref:Uncharacterized protein n=1 Tax=Sporothrix curviconia TaxID=1260050 RepID=A0ABP0B6C5_9PEZI